ncbi:hypothetical protein FBEOM_14564 [Fusarium beomiforme]|uniref:Methyltransferase n=1 Tax=Fusarium beomiforme TaxID=44412 RepID=A0A9P5DLT7_9HYPO|nr:hypothetical protein FBEOM_14564 [Fusarium beomiforme]
MSATSPTLAGLPSKGDTHLCGRVCLDQTDGTPRQPGENDGAWRDFNIDTSTLQVFPEQFGRTYHGYRAGCKLTLGCIPNFQADGRHAAYAFLNDTPEQERLEFQGECIKRLLDDRLYLAPLSTTRPPRAILDVATGVGDWAIQMGDLFPTSLVIGTDLSPIQPAEVPLNVHFYVEDS